MQYLYIAEETKLKYVPETEGHQSYYEYVPLGIYSKIGVTSQSPWERLRKLQVGNPRPLQFTHMWVGPYRTILHIESYIKNGYRSEWTGWSAEKMCEEVKKYIVEKNYDDVLKISKYTPYRAINQGSCGMHSYEQKNKKSCVRVKVYKNASQIYEDMQAISNELLASS
jgi:hypothetical protein